LAADLNQAGNMEIISRRIKAENIPGCATVCHDTVAMGIVLAGTAKILIHGTWHKLTAGEIYTAAPNTPYTLKDLSKTAQLLQIRFPMELIRTHREHHFYRSFWLPLSQGRLQLPAHLPACHPASPEIREQMLLFSAAANPLQQFAAAMELCLLLCPYCIHAIESRSDPGTENWIVWHCMIYIVNRYQNKIRLEDIARDVNCHPNYLCNLFKSRTGQTVFQHLTQIRLEAAMDILRKDPMPIGKIVEVTGFSCRNVFCKKFRQATGMTPTAYRKKYSIYQSAASDMPEG